jgi:hypothetical protein
MIFHTHVDILRKQTNIRRNKGWGFWRGTGKRKDNTHKRERTNGGGLKSFGSRERVREQGKRGGYLLNTVRSHLPDNNAVNILLAFVCGGQKEKKKKNTEDQ